MDDFYAARSGTIPPLAWPNIAPPFSGTRFSDLDPLGHINNVAMAAILEDARVRLSSAINGEAGLKPFRILIAAHLLNYVAEA